MLAGHAVHTYSHQGGQDPAQDEMNERLLWNTIQAGDLEEWSFGTINSIGAVTQGMNGGFRISSGPLNSLKEPKLKTLHMSSILIQAVQNTPFQKPFENKVNSLHVGLTDFFPRFKLSTAGSEDEKIGIMVRKAGYFAEAETLLFQRILTQDCSNKLVVDVGANIGYFTMLSLASGCRVVAFEPQPGARELIRQSLRLNYFNYEKITLLPGVVGTHDGTGSISLDGEWGMRSMASDISSEKASVSQFRLDRIIKEDVHLLKIDVEGFEHLVLAGTSDLFSHYNVFNILLEIKPTVDKSIKQQWLERILKMPGWEIHTFYVDYPVNDIPKFDIEREIFVKPYTGGWPEFEDIWIRCTKEDCTGLPSMEHLDTSSVNERKKSNSGHVVQTADTSLCIGVVDTGLYTFVKPEGTVPGVEIIDVSADTYVSALKQCISTDATWILLHDASVKTSIPELKNFIHTADDKLAHAKILDWLAKPDEDFPISVSQFALMSHGFLVRRPLAQKVATSPCLTDAFAYPEVLLSNCFLENDMKFLHSDLFGAHCASGGSGALTCRQRLTRGQFDAEKVAYAVMGGIDRVHQLRSLCKSAHFFEHRLKINIFAGSLLPDLLYCSETTYIEGIQRGKKASQKLLPPTLRHMSRIPKWTWLIVSDSDTTMNIDAILEYLLPTFNNRKEALILGQMYQAHGHVYPAGGAGFIMNRQALRVILQADCPFGDSQLDLWLGSCAIKSKVRMLDIPGFYQHSILTLPYPFVSTPSFSSHRSEGSSDLTKYQGWEVVNFMKQANKVLQSQSLTKGQIDKSVSVLDAYPYFL
ncbi:MAG: FkbM family methyltransferase [Akkermansiaceae bacterium]|nr:FkbM family methyltransferase [Akkermansiaceae bacterium]